jgi:hypothetical protein
MLRMDVLLVVPGPACQPTEPVIGSTMPVM